MIFKIGTKKILLIMKEKLHIKKIIFLQKMNIFLVSILNYFLIYKLFK